MPANMALHPRWHGRPIRAWMRTAFGFGFGVGVWGFGVGVRVEIERLFSVALDLSRHGPGGGDRFGGGLSMVAHMVEPTQCRFGGTPQGLCAPFTRRGAVTRRPRLQGGRAEPRRRPEASRCAHRQRGGSGAWGALRNRTYRDGGARDASAGEVRSSRSPSESQSAASLSKSPCSSRS
jgi:hypothetical protein